VVWLCIQEKLLHEKGIIERHIIDTTRAKDEISEKMKAPENSSGKDQSRLKSETEALDAKIEELQQKHREIWDKINNVTCKFINTVLEVKK
jgi:seryl-tRNA synthetase